MKKPNRFERVAQKCIDKHFEDCPIGCRLHSSIVAQLLRQEHVAMMRMVKGLLRQTMVGRKKYPDAVIFIGQQSVLEAVLFKLAKRKG